MINHPHRTYLITIIGCFFGIFCLQGQNERNLNWLFAYDYTIDSTNTSEGSLMTFQDDEVLFSKFSMDADIAFSNAVISDKNGHLLLYSNGCGVYNSEFELILNGHDLSTGGWIEERNCPTQGHIGRRDIILLPLNDSVYYLLHKFYELEEEPYLNLYAPILMSTKVSVGKDGISVIEKNKIVTNDLRLGMGYMTATQGKNNNGWWISQISDSGNIIFIYRLDENGIQLVEEVHINESIGSGSGQACFSPNGSSFSLYSRQSGLLIFDFDVESGTLTFTEAIDIPDTTGIAGYAISPNGNYGYVSSGRKMWQVNLLNQNINDRVILLDTFDGFGDPLPTRFAYGQLGPNCNIYFASTNGSRYLHEIKEPNLKGALCEFTQHSVELPNYYFPGSIPNLPFYRNDSQYNCDLTVSASELNFNSSISISPNPTTDLLHIKTGNQKIEGEVEIYDLTGRLLMSNSNSDQIDVSMFDTGIYFLVVYISGKRVSKKFVKIDY